MGGRNKWHLFQNSGDMPTRAVSAGTREMSKAPAYHGRSGHGNNYIQGKVFLLVARDGWLQRRKECRGFPLFETKEGILWVKKARRTLLDLVDQL